MKLLGVLNLMIAIVLNCSLSYAGSHRDTIPSTGEVEYSDSIIAAVPINLIRIANAKMIERNYLMSIAYEQDSIIALKDLYIDEQKSIIVELQNRIVAANEINESINNSLQKEKDKTKLIMYSSGAAIIALIIGLIIK